MPEAAVHLEFARQQIADAERLWVEGEEQAAELRFMQAEADAELALALARAVPLERESRRTAAQAESLRRGLPCHGADHIIGFGRSASLISA